MFGRNDFIEKLTSPKNMQFYAGLGRGENAAQAWVGANNWQMQHDMHNAQLKRNDLLFQQQQRDRTYNRGTQDLRNKYMQAQIDKMNAPGAPRETWEDVLDQDGQVIAQRSSLSNKYQTVPQGNEPYNPTYIDLPTEDGGSRKFERNPRTGELTPIGLEKQNPAKLAEGRKAQATYGRVVESVNRYRGLIERHGTEIVPGQAKSVLASAYNDLLLEMKELYNLGVLNGPDLYLMQEILMDPTAYTSKLRFDGQGEILAQIDNVVLPKITAARQNMINLYGDTVNVPEVVKRQQQQATAQMPPQIGTEMDGYVYVGGPLDQQSSWRIK